MFAARCLLKHSKYGSIQNKKISTLLQQIKSHELSAAAGYISPQRTLTYCQILVKKSCRYAKADRSCCRLHHPQAQGHYKGSHSCIVASHASPCSFRQFSTKPKEDANQKSKFNFHDNKRNEFTAPMWARGVTLVTLIGLVYYSIQDNEEQKEVEEEITRYNEMNEKTPMGGEWILLDENGEETNSRQFHGQWQLIYFGFSHCPDICPEEMNKMRAVVETLDSKRKAQTGSKKIPSIQPIFITLDPERDSPKVIKKYLEDFKIPRIKGFTANTLEEIKKVSKQFHVYFGFGEKDENDDYVVDHTIIMYLVNSEGKFVNYYSRALDAEPIVRSIERHMKLWEKITNPIGGAFYAKP